MLWRRTFAVWLVIIGAETVHGGLRQLFLAPLVGELRARQIGVVIGSAIVLAVAVAFSRWLGARSVREQLGVGLAWTVLTVGFEAGLGKLLGLSPARMLSDYDLTAGGWMAFGLGFLLASPWLAANLRRSGDSDR